MSGIGRLCFRQLAILGGALVLEGCLATAVSAQSPASSQGFEALAQDATSDREAGRVDNAIRNYRAALDLRPNWDEGWWYLGTLLYDGDHFAEALPALGHVVELDPKVGAGWAFLGLCEFETGDYRDAYDHLQTADQLGFAESPELQRVALYHLAVLFNLHGEFDRATSLLTRAFDPSRLPEQIKVSLGLALLRVPLLPAQVDPEKDARVHAAGEVAALLAHHELDAALRGFEQMLRDDPDTPYLHYQYGRALAEASLEQRAESQFREETRITSRSALPWIALSSLHNKRNRPGEALTAAEHAVQLAPHSAAAYQALAQALERQSRHQEAAAASERAQALANEPLETDAAQANRYSLIGGGVPGMPSAGKDSRAESAGSSGAPSFEEAARLAESARRAGRVEQAAAGYRTGLRLRPDWQEGWRQLGTVEYMAGHYAASVAALRQSVALEANHPDTWTLLGLSEFETKDYRNSLLHLERGRALGFSGNAAAVRVSRYHLAVLEILNGDFDRAIDLLIPEIGPGALAEEIQFAMGIALLRIAALPEQVQPAQRSLVRTAGEAAVLLSQSHYDRALPILAKLVSEHSGTRFLHYAYGDALAAISSYDEARSELREEARLNPGSELAYLRLASIALLLHQPAAALADSENAVRVAPNSADAHYFLGRTYLEGAETAEAISELETARRLAPNSPKVRFNLARAYDRAQRTAEAQQERAEFVRLNAQIETQRSPGDRAVRGTVGEGPVQPAAK
jgi:tetratricopeptide (TPR) repeat protein